VIVGLHGDHHLPQACQDLLRLSQRQPQLGDIAEATKRPDTHHVDNPGRSIDLRFNQSHGLLEDGTVLDRLKTAARRSAGACGPS
jgi:hypothetical protein